MKRLRRLGFLGGILCSAGCASWSPEPVAPHRPTLTSDPSTTAHSTLEVEAGLWAAENRALDVPVALKWGATEEAELLVAWSPYVRLADRDGAADGTGDIVFGSRVRFRDESEKAPAAGIEMMAKLPLADDNSDIGTGLVDFFLAGSAAKSLGAGMIVGYYKLGVLSNQGPGGTILEHTVSSAISTVLSGPLQGYAEVAGIFTPQQDLEALLFGVGLGYTVTPRLIFDMEGFFGLTNDASPVAFAAGFTTNLGSLF